jgi:hypothetical protein
MGASGAIGCLKEQEVLLLTVDRPTSMAIDIPGEGVRIVEITLEAKSGRIAQLRIRASSDVKLQWPKTQKAAGLTSRKLG